MANIVIMHSLFVQKQRTDPEMPVTAIMAALCPDHRGGDLNQGAIPCCFQGAHVSFMAYFYAQTPDSGFINISLKPLSDEQFSLKDSFVSSILGKLVSRSQKQT